MTSISGNGFIDTAITGGSLYDVVNNLDENALYKNEDIVMPSNKITIRDLEVLNSTTLAGNTSVINATDVEITDRTLLLGKGNTNTNIALVCDTSTAKKGGLLYNPVAGNMKLFKTNQALAGASVNESDPTYELANVEANEAILKDGETAWSLNSNPSLELGTVNSKSGVIRLYGTANTSHSTIQTSNSNLHLDCHTSAGVGILLNNYTTTKSIILGGSGVRVGSGATAPTVGYRLDCDGALRVNGNCDLFGQDLTLSNATQARFVQNTSGANAYAFTSLRRSGTRIWEYGLDGEATALNNFYFFDVLNSTKFLNFKTNTVANGGTRIGISTTDPQAKLHCVGNARIDGRTTINNDTLQLASLTTAQRNALVGVSNGSLIFNSTTGLIEKYEAGVWSSLSGGGGSISESSLSAHTLVLKGALSANLNTTWNFYKVGKLVHARYDFFSGNTNTLGTITTVSGQIPVDFRPGALFQGSVFHPDSAMKVYPVDVDTSGNFTLKNTTGGNFSSGVSVTVVAGFLSWVTA